MRRMRDYLLLLTIIPTWIYSFANKMTQLRIGARWLDTF
jgi:hypothetical protein